MNALDIAREDLSNTVVLKLHGTFNGAAAVKLRETIEALGDREVVLDFSRVGPFQDLAIPILTRGLRHPALHVKGVGKQQARVFSCFGVATADGAREQPEFWTPEALMF